MTRNKNTPVKEKPFPLYQMLIVMVLLGLAGRVWIADLATRWGYWPDHFDNISAGLTCERVGLLKIYSVQWDQLAPVSGEIYQNGQLQAMTRPAAMLPYHPPLYDTMRWAQVKLVRALTGGTEANTLTARLVLGSVPVLAELVCAVGVGLLVWQLSTRRAGIVAGAICWFFPPIALNTAFWEQVDSLFLAPAAFMVLFMLRRRWFAAGLCLALAALLKSQGLILAPIALFGLLTLAQEQGDVTSKVLLKRAGQMALATLGLIAVVTLPWTIADGFNWVQRCYYFSFTQAYPDTTLKAFNLWYVDALRLDKTIFALDSQATIAGITKDAWGRALLLVALAGAAWICWRKYRRGPLGIVLFSALWLWSIFMMPTRVHERYMIYCVPFVIVLAVCMRRYWPALIALAIVGAAEHTWNVWMDGPSAGGPMPFRRQVVAAYQKDLAAFDREAADVPIAQRRPRPTFDDFMNRPDGPMDSVRRYMPQYVRERRALEKWEYLLTALSLLAYAWTFGAAAYGVRTDPPQGPPTSQKKGGKTPQRVTAPKRQPPAAGARMSGSLPPVPD